MNQRFGRTYHLHLHGRKSAGQEASENKWLGRMSCQSGYQLYSVPTDSSFCLATCSRWFLGRLIFDPEDGDDTFFRNVGSYTDYTVLYHRRWQLKKKEAVCLWKEHSDILLLRYVAHMDSCPNPHHSYSFTHKKNGESS
jgi:hypothetical protein